MICKEEQILNFYEKFDIETNIDENHGLLIYSLKLPENFIYWHILLSVIEFRDSLSKYCVSNNKPISNFVTNGTRQKIPK